MDTTEAVSEAEAAPAASSPGTVILAGIIIEVVAIVQSFTCFASFPSGVRPVADLFRSLFLDGVFFGVEFFGFFGFVFGGICSSLVVRQLPGTANPAVFYSAETTFFFQILVRISGSDLGVFSPLFHGDCCPWDARGVEIHFSIVSGCRDGLVSKIGGFSSLS